jgi:CheY-like chemotaxis protein
MQRIESVGRLAGGVAHDFNNLLTVIFGHIELLRKEIRTSSEQISVEEISRAGERAASLIRQLLVFSRGQPGESEIVDLNQIVINFETMLRRLIGEDIELITNLAGQPLRVQANVGQIEQVIMNLAVNARDAMPGGGCLTIQTEAKGFFDEGEGPEVTGLPNSYALLAVKDTGIGMDEHTKQHLFDPFFTTKQVGKGTGLGLSVTYGIVKSHKGQLRVKSEPMGGSVFEVYLPINESLSEEAKALVPPPIAEARAATILLVEDDPSVRDLMRDILTGLGYLVLDSTKGDEAILVAANHEDEIDLLVTDIVMPGLSGVELAKRLALVRPNMKVLYVSGYADNNTATRVLGSAAAGYLQKPFTPDDLARKVEGIIRSIER